MDTGIEVFFSYAHEDEELCKKLEQQLTLLKRWGTIHIWHDRNIDAGSEREKEIDAHLNTAQIILLLVSPEFIASDYCYSVEMKRALERHKRGEAHVIPVLLRPTAFWKDTPLQQFQVLPTNRRPITDWDSQDKAFFHIVTEIKKVIQKLQERGPIQKDKPQENNNNHVPAPQNKTANHADSASSTRKKKSQAPTISPHQSMPPVQHISNQTSNQFHAQVQGVISGGTNTIHFNTTFPPAEDILTKGRNDARRGYHALQQKDYVSAKRYLEAADLAFFQDEHPAESAQVKYYIALALLNGQRPFSLNITKSIMQQIDQILSTAIKLQPLHSYYYTLALFKRDFARHGLPQYRRDAQTLSRKAQSITLTTIDKENLQLLTLCLPRLVHDAQQSGARHQNSRKDGKTL